MAAAAHNPAFAKKVGIPAKVAKEFNQADKGKTFKQGGEMAVKKFDPKKLFKGKESVGEELKEAKAIKSGKITPMQYAKGEKSEPVKKMKEGGLSMSARNSADTQRSSATVKKTPSEMIVDEITKGKSPTIPKELQKPEGKKKGGVIKKMKTGRSCHKGGGFVRAADGCATKGKTRGRFI